MSSRYCICIQDVPFATDTAVGVARLEIAFPSASSVAYLRDHTNYLVSTAGDEKSDYRFLETLLPLLLPQSVYG
jgi:hypothetical protein